MSSWNCMLSRVEYENNFITPGPGVGSDGRTDILDILKPNGPFDGRVLFIYSEYLNSEISV